MDFFFGVLFGCLMGIVIALTLVSTSSVWFKTHEIIVRKSHSGLVCYKDDSYPKLNCTLIREAIGPKKTEFKFKVEEK